MLIFFFATIYLFLPLSLDLFLDLSQSYNFHPLVKLNNLQLQEKHNQKVD